MVLLVGEKVLRNDYHEKASKQAKDTRLAFATVLVYLLLNFHNT